MKFGRSGTQVWAPNARMSKIKNSRLDQYDAEPFEQQQFGTAGFEGVNDNAAWRLKQLKSGQVYGRMWRQL